MNPIISKNVQDFKSWFTTNGGFFHPDAQFQQEPSGHKIAAEKDVPVDTTVATCPFKIAITKELSTLAILPILGIDEAPPEWTERQLICTYICLHWLFEESPDFPDSLEHLPYLKILPKQEQLLTSLHFSEKELELFRGSHLYVATADRRNILQTEWQGCLNFLKTTSNGDMYQREYTWTRFLTAATHLSSRGFSSSFVSGTPSTDVYPVLFPGVDSFNHARRQSVTWLVDPTPPANTARDLWGPQGLSLLIHPSTPSGEEILNNYGPKPNSELILGYGFSLEGNPDDTIVLTVGRGPTSDVQIFEDKERWEVGRDASGVEGVWDRVLKIVSSIPSPEEIQEPEVTKFENQYDAAETLSEMCQAYLSRLPKIIPAPNLSPPEPRQEVLTMFTHYIQGQRDILGSMVKFAERKGEEALEEAKKLGIELEFE